MLDDVEWKTFLIWGLALVFMMWITNSLFHDDMFKKKENFDTDPITDDIEKVVNFVRKEIENGKDKRKWRTYRARKESNYYRLYGDQDDDQTKEPVMSVRVDVEDGLKRYRVFKGINPVGTEVRETEENGSDLTGRHARMTNRISVNHGRERVTIRLRNNQIKISGLGGFAGSNSLPHPWYYGAPIVWTEGGRAIGFMDYANDRRLAKPDMPYLPVEISVPEDQERELPLLLQTYAILHENISKKRI